MTTKPVVESGFWLLRSRLRVCLACDGVAGLIAPSLGVLPQRGDARPHSSDFPFR